MTILIDWSSLIVGVLVIVVGGGLAAFMRWLFQTAGRRLHDDLINDMRAIVDDMIQRALSIERRHHRDDMTDIIEQLNLIRLELQTNAGQSLKDEVIALGRRMSNIESQLEVRLLEDPTGKGR